MKQIKQFHYNEKGVSEVIGAILILTILVSFLSILQAYSVPVWNNEIEFAHFNRLYDDVLDLKRIIGDTAVYDMPRTAVLHTSLDYPNRMFLINPSKPSVLITTRYDKPVTITYDGNVIERVTSCTLRVEEKYTYFPAPALVLEHGMIIGDTGSVNYTIDDPILDRNNMNVLLVGCDNTSFGTTTSSNLNINPVMLSAMTVNNATISFITDYPALWREYLKSIGANWTLSGNVVTVNYYNVTKIRVMGVSLGSPANLSILPVTNVTPVPTATVIITPTATPTATATLTSTPTPVPTPAPLILDSFETVGDKGYSSSGSGTFIQNFVPSYVTHQYGSLQINYDFTFSKTDKQITVNINYNRYTPARSFNISNYTFLKIDVYGDASNYSASFSIRGGSTTYEWQPVQINWTGWKTISLPLLDARTAGVDLTAVDMVEIKILEMNMPFNKKGTIYCDYLLASY